MASNIRVQRICQHCGIEFTARTTTTMYCSKPCNSQSIKDKLKAEKIEASNQQTRKTKYHQIEQLNAKEYLTVREVAQLLNCSLRSAYRQISEGTIYAVNFGQRITRVKRSNIEKLFEQPLPSPITTKKPNKELHFSDCYTTKEVREKYGISDRALWELIKRNKIPKLKKGWFAYVPKTAIDKIFELKHTA